jgi:DNA-binding MarR family transcriptional regulator
MTGPAPSAPSQALREVLLTAAVANHAIARRLELGPTDLTAFDHLLDGPPRGTRELADLLGVRSPSATALVDRLETAGLVRRVPHGTDRRRVRVEPTDDGRARTGAVLAPLLAELDALAARLAPDEQQLVAEHLHAVAGVLRRFADPGP